MTVRSLITRLTLRDQTSTIHDIVSAVVIFILGMILLALGVHAFDEFPVLVPFRPEELHWWHSVPLALASIATGFQTRYPLGVFYAITGCLLVDMALGLHLAVLIPWANTVYNAGRYTPGTRLRWLLLAFNALVFCWIWVFSGEIAAALNGLLQIALTSLIAVWWGSEVRRGDEQTEAERLKSLAARRREEHERQELLRRQRADLAAQLHDTISSHLSTISIYTAGSLDAPRDPARDTEVLTEIRHASLAALSQMRELIDVLRTFTDDDQATAAAPSNVTQVLERLRAAGLAITMTDETQATLRATLSTVDTPETRAVTHVLQEALTNALKHGDGTATIHCETTSDRLSCTVWNPLADSTEPLMAKQSEELSGGLGLGAMATVIHHTGGLFAAGTTADAGTHHWEVRLDIPITQQHHATQDQGVNAP